MFEVFFCNASKFMLASRIKEKIISRKLKNREKISCSIVCCTVQLVSIFYYGIRKAYNITFIFENSCNESTVVNSILWVPLRNLCLTSWSNNLFECLKYEARSDSAEKSNLHSFILSTEFF